MPLGMESWFSNFSQLSRSWNSPETLADIPRPYLEFAVWGLFKGAEVMSVLGGFIAHPIYRVYLRKKVSRETFTPNSYKIIRNQCRKLQGRFLLAGIFAGPTLAISHVYYVGFDEVEVKEKCYRIRCDMEGMTIDRCAFVCGFVGWYWKRFQGAVDGINLGVSYALFNNKFLSQYTSPVLKDKVLPQDRYESIETAMENRSKLVKFMAEKERRLKHMMGSSDNSEQ